MCDLDVPTIREYVGLHELYDGVVQDLSPSGSGGRPGPPGRRADRDRSARRGPARGVRGRAAHQPRAHRGVPPQPAAPPVEPRRGLLRASTPRLRNGKTRRRHLAAWPDAVDAAIEALDRVPAPVAEALLPGVRGLAEASTTKARWPRSGGSRPTSSRPPRRASPDASLGADALARLMGDAEGMTVDLGRLAEQADSERDRLMALLDGACGRHLEPGATPSVTGAGAHGRPRAHRSTTSTRRPGS